MARNSPPLPDDGIYRAILLVLVLSVVAGAILTLTGRLVLRNEAVTEAGLWISLVCAGIYVVFRWLGQREARKRARDDNDAGGDLPPGPGPGPGPQ